LQYNFRLAFSVASDPNISDYATVMVLFLISNIILLFAAAFYLLIQFGLAAGLRRLDHSMNNTRPFVSVIVAARNEENNIPQLLHCLSHQTYPYYEIIIVNDRSTDKTSQLIDDCKKKYANITSIDITMVPDDMPAKKNALRAGIAGSKGEILCFTDADCLPNSAWIEELVKLFVPGVGLVAGYSPYQIPNAQISKQGLFKKLFFEFIRYEEYRAALWAAGSIGWNKGWLCTGRNLAYRRKVYDAVNGFEQIKMSISGDDDLFLQLVRRQTNWKITYIVTPESFVRTNPPSDLKSFLEQRKRHFSAAKYFPITMKLFFFLYHSSNLLLFLSPFLLFIHVFPSTVIIVAFCSKLIGDSILNTFSHHTFAADHFWKSFVLMEALYVIYNSIVGPLGIFRKFAWKQR
jgi:cellulose synthase/poly-beta-1,6-N-acetylglucosamine synthase-like glycosyltransferase